LMIYVFSDGSLSSNGMLDNSVNGRGKGVWTGDNQATAASLMLVYNPGGVRMRTMTGGVPRRQLGWYSAEGAVVNTSHPGANAVNLLVEEVILNYLALHGREGEMQTLFPNHG